MSLLYSSTQANPDQEKVESTAEAARVLLAAVRENLRPSEIITRKSIENAVSLIMAVGGSTNAVLHYLAIAHSAGIEWTIDDFERIRRKVPVLCDLKPSGQYVATDLHRAGGIPQVLKILLTNGLLHGDCMTITGRTMAEILAEVPAQPRAGQDVIRPFHKPLYPQGHLAILKGNLALVKEGDSITIDADRLLLQLDVDDAELALRRAAWKPPAPRYTRGVLAKFAKLASTASRGAITDERLFDGN